MPLEVLATAVLPEGQYRVQSLAFSSDGASLLVGLVSHEAFDDQLRIATIPWADGGPARTVGLPHEAMRDTLGLVRPVDHDLAATGSPERLWRLAPRPLRLAAGCWALIGGGEVVGFEAPTTIRWPGGSVGIAPATPVRSVALAPDRSHVAFSDHGRVVLVGADGRERCSWPGTAAQLACAPDDLGLWGRWQDTLTWYPWQGVPVPTRMIGVRPWDFDAATRRALFASGSELIEVDLGSGERKDHGAFRQGGQPDACDPARRRVARFEADDRFRVYQLV